MNSYEPSCVCLLSPRVIGMHHHIKQLAFSFNYKCPDIYDSAQEVTKENLLFQVSSIRSIGKAPGNRIFFPSQDKGERLRAAEAE